MGKYDYISALPPAAIDLLRSRVSAEFATISMAGDPIDTPTFYFPAPDLATIDIGTGLAYPVKASRARRNPMVGLLIEGEADAPVISIAGHAAVRDADIQANLERYLAETIHSPNVDPALVPWDRTRKRLYYLARIIVEISPVVVRWWPDRTAMANPPLEWRAPARAVFPASDPAPVGAPAKAPMWRQEDWQTLADQAMAGGMPCHLTLLEDGYPLPVRVRDCARSESGFDLVIPAGMPGQSGRASLSFVGREIFVGATVRSGERVRFTVERGLPVLPMMDERSGMSPGVIQQLEARMDHELIRRGQARPIVPEFPPEPTAGARLRAQLSRSIDPAGIGGGLAR